MLSDHWEESKECTDTICSEIQFHMPLINEGALSSWLTWFQTEIVSNQPMPRMDWDKIEKLTYWDLFQPRISYNETHSESFINTKCPFLNYNLSMTKKKIIIKQLSSMLTDINLSTY